MAFTRGNFWAAVNKARKLAWLGESVTYITKGPDLINNESLSAIDAAGTSEVELIKADASDRVVLPNGARPTLPINLAGVTASGTTGTGITTSTDWVIHTAAGQCLIKTMAENACDTGEFATLRLRARANNTTVSGNGGNSVGATACSEFSASAIDHEFGNLFGCISHAQPNAKNQTVDATNIVCGIYSRIDATGTSIGRRWVQWLDTHATTKASGGDYMARVSHNGSAAIDGVWTIYAGGRLPVLFNFEDVGAGCPVTVTGSDASGFYGRVAVYAGGALRYINLYTTSNA